MQYVRDLEGKVRKYQLQQGRIDRIVWLCGFLVGAGVAGLVFWFLVHR
jgi:hypothetical protein